MLSTVAVQKELCVWMFPCVYMLVSYTSRLLLHFSEDKWAAWSSPLRRRLFEGSLKRICLGYWFRAKASGSLHLAYRHLQANDLLSSAYEGLQHLRPPQWTLICLLKIQLKSKIISEAGYKRISQIMPNSDEHQHCFYSEHPLTMLWSLSTNSRHYIRVCTHCNAQRSLLLVQKLACEHNCTFIVLKYWLNYYDKSDKIIHWTVKGSHQHPSVPAVQTIIGSSPVVEWKDFIFASSNLISALARMDGRTL